MAYLRTHLSLQDIADRLHLARPTVKTHVASIYVKLGVTGRSDAVEIIEQAGLESTEAKVTMPDQISAGVAVPRRRWLTGQAVRGDSSEDEAHPIPRLPADTPNVAA